MLRAIVVSAIESAKAAEHYGLAHDKIILSAKVSGVQDLIAVYRMLAAECVYPLHLGLTEAGLGSKKGIVATTAAIGVLLQEGIGDTIRASLTPLPNGDRNRGSDREPADTAIAGTAQLHSAGDGVPRLRPHHQHVLSGHGGSDPDLSAHADAHLEGAVHGR